VCVDALSSGGAGFSLLDSSDRLLFVDQLISVIESKGLSVVGLYRVAGNAQKIKQLVKDMTTTAAGIITADQSFLAKTSSILIDDLIVTYVSIGFTYDQNLHSLR